MCHGFSSSELEENRFMASYNIVQSSSTVGQIIKEYRKSHGMTQKQLAYEIGVEARTLRMYENGKDPLDQNR